MSIFKRRDKVRFWRRARESVWPSMGWARTLDYYRHRIFRTGDSTYKVSAGLAAGAALSFTPFLGTHILQSVVASYVLRANWVAAVAGTLFGNPATFPLLFAAAYAVGVEVCSWFGLRDFLALPDDMTFDHFMAEPFDFLAFMFSHPVQFLLPMSVGGYVCALMAWPLVYALVYFPVRHLRKLYRLQRLRRARARRRNRRRA